MTLLLHGAVRDGRLLVWGESPAAPVATTARRRAGRARGTAPPAASPFDPGPAALSAASAESGFGALGTSAETAILWLPSRDGRPLASSPLVAEPPPDGDTILAPWSVSALCPAPLAAAEFLAACIGRRMLAPGIVVAEDLAFWAAALRLAGALVARHAYLPDLVEEDGAFLARWRAMPAAQEMESLARAMPPAARAAGAPSQPPDGPAALVLGDFVQAMVDALVRGTLPPAGAAPGKALRRRAKAAAVGDGVDQRWLAALRAPDPRVAGDPDDLRGLVRRLGDWRRPIDVTLAGPCRLCFRLEEPPSEVEEKERPVRRLRRGGGKWLVRYLVQARDDPGLLVPLPQAWAARGRAAAPFRAKGLDIRELLLTALGQAARLSAPVEASLAAGVPEGYATDAAGAVAFLTEMAPALENAGFGVMLPAWWVGKRTKRRLAARAVVKAPRMQGGGGLSLEDIVAFDWEIALGEERLTHAELMALAKLKVPLVRVRGQWVLLDAAEIAEAVARLERRGNTMTVREAMRLALGAAETEGASPVEVAATGWIGELLARLGGREAIAELAPPAHFDGTLRPYQRRGFSWLDFLRRWGLGACLADDMGLGKTIQTLALLAHDKEAAARTGRPRPSVLLVCPTSVVGNWQHEAARFTPDLAVMVHHGGGRARGDAFRKAVAAHDLVITGYSLLQRDAAALGAVSWSGVILDEAQNIKNPETRQARAARALASGYRIALTGTPVENNVGDLWSLMGFLNPGFLGSQAAFRRRFFLPIQASRDAAAIEGLRRLTEPFILRRVKTDKAIIDDLPEKMEMKVFCRLTREQASLYAAVVEEATAEIEGAEGIRRKGVVLATLSKLKQVCNHPAQFHGDNSPLPGRSGKLERLAEMLEEVMALDERALVFTQFSEMGGLIKSHLESLFGREVSFLHGAVPKARRDGMVARFQAADPAGPRVFVLSLKAGGTGLNLTAASHVFHFDRWWNPAVEDQATDRAFRIGQRRRVEVHKFLCLGTVEDRIDEMIERKRGVAGAVVGTGEDWLTRLSTAELRELFALRREAVMEEA